MKDSIGLNLTATDAQKLMANSPFMAQVNGQSYRLEKLDDGTLSIDGKSIWSIDGIHWHDNGSASLCLRANKKGE